MCIDAQRWRSSGNTSCPCPVGAPGALRPQLIAAFLERLIISFPRVSAVAARKAHPGLYDRSQLPRLPLSRVWQQHRPQSGVAAQQARQGLCSRGPQLPQPRLPRPLPEIIRLLCTFTNGIRKLAGPKPCFRRPPHAAEPQQDGNAVFAPVCTSGTALLTCRRSLRVFSPASSCRSTSRIASVACTMPPEPSTHASAAAARQDIDRGYATSSSSFIRSDARRHQLSAVAQPAMAAAGRSGPF